MYLKYHCKTTTILCIILLPQFCTDNKKLFSSSNPIKLMNANDIIVLPLLPLLCRQLGSIVTLIIIQINVKSYKYHNIIFHIDVFMST